MYKRFILLSNLLLILSIAPVWAQYSFKKTIYKVGYDMPMGMKQASDGMFYVYGHAGFLSPSGVMQNYIAKIDHFGNILWQRGFVDRSYGDNISDLLELSNGNLLLGCYAQEQLQMGNARIVILSPSGEFLLDTIYPLNQGQSGGIDKWCVNEEKKTVVSLGYGKSNWNTHALMFQITDYTGKRLWHKWVPYSEFFRLKKIFKAKDKEEYIVFGEKNVIRLDSMGKMIGTEEVATQNNAKIYDIVQDDDGTFTTLVLSRLGVHGFYLQKHDVYGKALTFTTRITGSFLDDHLWALTATKDKGYLAAGTHFFLIDSNGLIVWQKESGGSIDVETVSVAQAADGGFYGCAIDWRKNDAGDPDIYYFKTTAEGIITGLNDNQNKQLKVQVMPNPSSGLFTITGEFNEAQVTVSNLLGQTVLQAQNINVGDKLNATQLQNGIYFLSIISGNATYVQKVNVVK